MKRTAFQLLLIFIAITPLRAINEKSVDSLLTQLKQADAPQKLSLLLELSEYYYEREPARAATFAGDAYEIAVRQSDLNLQAKALFSIGYVAYLMNEYDKSLLYLKKAHTLWLKLENADGVASCLNRMGNVWQLKGDYEQALSLYKQSFFIVKNLPDNAELPRILTNMGSIYQLYGDYKQAINYMLQALGIYEDMKNDEGMAWSYLNIARLFKKMSDYEKALQYVNNSYQMYKKIADVKGIKTGVALCLKEKGSIYQDMGNFDKALEYGLKVLELNTAAANQHGIASSLYILGRIYYSQNRYEDAIKNMQQSMKQKALLGDSLDLAAIHRYLGYIYLKQGSYSQSQTAFTTSIRMAKKQNLRDELRDVYMGLSDLSRLQGKYNKALDYYIQFSALKDSLNDRDILQREMQYEFNRRQHNMELEQIQKEEMQKSKLQRQKLLTMLFIGFFIFTLLLALSIYRNFKVKKAANEKLALQNEEIRLKNKLIEAQRDDIKLQHDQISNQNKLITDSIRYAQRIQTAILPQEKMIQQLLGEHFIFYLPKNIVSGDFYWIGKHGSKIVIAAADCTGHGVPGAFMSMLGVAFLNEIVNKLGIVNPDEILFSLRRNVIDALHQSDEIGRPKDGMDIALVTIDTATRKLQFAGAHNPMYHFNNGTLSVYKGSRMPIGIHSEMSETPFELHELSYAKGDVIYLFSDGIIDQFGGPKNSKFKQSMLMELLTNLQNSNMDDQKAEIVQTFSDWKGKNNQLDDILMLGVRME